MNQPVSYFGTVVAGHRVRKNYNKNRTIVNVKNTFTKPLSLGIGLAVSVVLIAKICFELNYDNCYSDADRICVIKTHYSMQGDDKDYGQVSGGVAPGFKRYIPGVKAATRTTGFWDSEKFLDEENNVISGKGVLADTSFFDVFDTGILAGDPKKALGMNLTVMVSRSFAEKLGGVDEAIGKIIHNEETPGVKMTVEGVFEDFPHHSSKRYDVLLSMESMNKRSSDNWLGNDRYKGYVRLEKGTDIDMLAPAIRLMQEKNQPLDEIEKTGNSLEYYLVPLVKDYKSSASVRNMMTILVIIAILLIVISLLNYILIAISAMVKRSKEMGVRKCFGARTSSIYSLMTKEAAIDMIFALATAAVIILSLRSVIGDIVDVPLNALFIPQTIWVLACVIAIVFIVAAVLPARLYSSVPVATAIRNYKENKRIWKLCLLFVQIGVSALFLCLVLVIGRQYDKAVNEDTGYDYENLLYANIIGVDMSAQPALIERLSTVAGVKDVQMSFSLPIEFSNGDNVLLPESDKELFNIADQYYGTEGLFDMLGIPFVEGHYPRSESEVAVSESFLDKMAQFEDWSDGAVGKQVRITSYDGILTICGVYKDYRINTLTNAETRASVRTLGIPGESYMPIVFIKVEETNPEIMARLDEVLKEMVPSREISVTAYSDTMRESYSGELKMRNTVIVGCVVCVLIALFGLIGYVRDETERRGKEMAIRKINGAKTRDIMSLFVSETLKLSLAAVIAADAGAYFIAKAWLRNFSERIALSPWYFIAGDLVVIALVIGTVVLNCLRISRANPVESLKNE